MSWNYTTLNKIYKKLKKIYRKVGEEEKEKILNEISIIKEIISDELENCYQEFDIENFMEVYINNKHIIDYSINYLNNFFTNYNFDYTFENADIEKKLTQIKIRSKEELFSITYKFIESLNNEEIMKKFSRLFKERYTDIRLDSSKEQSSYMFYIKYFDRALINVEFNSSYTSYIALIHEYAHSIYDCEYDTNRSKSFFLEAESYFFEFIAISKMENVELLKSFLLYQIYSIKQIYIVDILFNIILDNECHSVEKINNSINLEYKEQKTSLLKLLESNYNIDDFILYSVGPIIAFKLYEIYLYNPNMAFEKLKQIQSIKDNDINKVIQILGENNSYLLVRKLLEK